MPTYAHVVNGRCYRLFTSLPDREVPGAGQDVGFVVDVTGNEPNVGYSFANGAFSPYVPTPQEAADLLAKQQAKADALVTFLIEKTPAEVVARINSDVTDLASARQVIAKLAVALSVLTKQSLR